MKLNLIAKTDEHMCRQRIHMPRKSAFYPSEASVQWTDLAGQLRTAGTCLRAAWFRYTGHAEKAGQVLRPDPYSEWIFALGKAVETILVEQWKQMGIWVANNVEFYDAKHNISGEIDCIIRIPGWDPFLVECKSYYGYAATKQICGNKSTVPRPKTSQMLQTLIYVDQFKEYFNYAKMIYYARDSASRNEFDIALIEDASQPARGILHRPTVNGIADVRFHLEDIYDRYKLLEQYVNAKEIPPADYEIVWSPEKVYARQALGEIAKTTFEKWQKKPQQNAIGDWNCSFCKYRNICWKNGVAAL
jgi:hypothetical protein